MTGQESWRPVVGWEGLYEVSSLGRVRSLLRTVHLKDDQGRIYQTRTYSSLVLRYDMTAPGYPAVHLSREGRPRRRFVHVLVCEAFHGPRPSDHQAAHGDGNRANPQASNLRWASRAENCADAVIHGTAVRGERTWNAVLTEEKVRAIRADHAAGMRQVEIAAKHNATKVTVNNVVHRRSWGWVI